MNDLEKRFIEARTRAIATDYAHLNPRQLEGAATQMRYRCQFPGTRWNFWSSMPPGRTRSSGR